MSDRAMFRARAGIIRVRLLFVIALLVIAALAVYLGMVHQRAPRRLKLALVTWTQDPFWKPLIRGRRIMPTNQMLN